MRFTKIPYAVTLPDGELVDENYTGNSPLVCEFCGVSLVLVTGTDGAKYYQHILSAPLATTVVLTCSYRANSPGELRRTSPVLHGRSLTPHEQKVIPFPTIKHNWCCVLCNHRYYGNKQCPKCGDWVCTVECM
ncbi:hypothetical protein ACEZSF_001448 [Escherichia coli]